MCKMPVRLFKTFYYTNKSKLGKALINFYPSNNKKKKKERKKEITENK